MTKIDDASKMLEVLEEQGPFLTASMALHGDAPLDWAGRASYLAASKLAERFAHPKDAEPIDPVIQEAWELLELFGRLFTEDSYRVTVKSKKSAVTNRMLEAAIAVKRRVDAGQQQEQALGDISIEHRMHRSKITAAMRFRKVNREQADRRIAEMSEQIESLRD